MSFIESLLSFLFPPSCFACSKAGVSLCRECGIKIPEAKKHVLSFIFASFDYKNEIIRKLIWRLKYRGGQNLARELAESAYGRLLGELSERKEWSHFDKLTLVPIPLSASRQKERGYNQSLLLAEALMAEDKGVLFSRVENLIYRIKDTPPQMRIRNRKKRAENIKGAFALSPNCEVSQKDILLVDDVTTTGATLEEAREILLQAGARQVLCFALAH